MQYLKYMRIDVVKEAVPSVKPSIFSLVIQFTGCGASATFKNGESLPLIIEKLRGLAAMLEGKEKS